MNINEMNTYYYADGTVEKSEYRNYNKLLSNLDGPSIINEITNYTSYYVYGKFLGVNLSKKIFEKYKQIALKEHVFK